MSRASVIAISATFLIVAGPSAFAQSTGGGSTISAPPSVNPSLGSTSGSDVGTSGAKAGGVGNAGSAGSVSGTGISTSGPARAGAFSEDASVATEGSGSVNSTNVDSIARGASFGAATSSTSSGASAGGDQRPLSGSADAASQNYGRAGGGTSQEFSIPEPKIGVDLQAIRGAMAADSSATPKANGD